MKMAFYLDIEEGVYVAVLSRKKEQTKQNEHSYRKYTWVTHYTNGPP